MIVQSWWTSLHIMIPAVPAGEGRVHDSFCGVCLEQGRYHPQVSILPGHPAPYLLSRDSGFYLCVSVHRWTGVCLCAHGHVCACVCVCHWHFQVADCSISKPSVYKRQKIQIPGNSLCILFISTFQCLLIAALYIFSRVLSCDHPQD